MRIIWDTTESVFAAEFTDFASDLDAVKAAGFRTFGAPAWVWYAPSPGVKALERLRKNPPKSGLVITEVALQKYKSVKEEFDKKAEFKKTFEKLRVAARKEQAGSKVGQYEKDGFISFIVQPCTEKFVHTYAAPAPPTAWCFICGDSVHEYEGTDLCLWCSEKF